MADPDDETPDLDELEEAFQEWKATRATWTGKSPAGRLLAILERFLIKKGRLRKP